MLAYGKFVGMLKLHVEHAKKGFFDGKTMIYFMPHSFLHSSEYGELRKGFLTVAHYFLGS